MIIQGWWEDDGRPYIAARVQIPGVPSVYVDLQVDTGATHTVIAERTFSTGTLRSLGAPTVPISTSMGPVKGWLVDHSKLWLCDIDGKEHLVDDLKLHFFQNIALNSKQWRSFKDVFGDSFPQQIQAPRNLLGRDVLNRYLMISRQDQALLLTDRSQNVLTHVKQALRITRTQDLL